MPQYWIIVERYENWLIDRQQGFVRFGLPESKRVRVDEVKAGDLLIAYISSGRSSFADVRRVTSSKTVRLRFGGEYQGSYPIALVTEPIITLPEEKWIRVQSISSQLSFLKSKDWRMFFRTSLRQIPERDGAFIYETLKAASADDRPG